MHPALPARCLRWRWRRRRFLFRCGRRHRHIGKCFEQQQCDFFNGILDCHQHVKQRERHGIECFERLVHGQLPGNKRGIQCDLKQEFRCQQQYQHCQYWLITSHL